MSTTIAPKATKNSLEPVKDTIAVEAGLFVEYYPIKLGEKRGGFVQILQLPPVLKEGYVTFDRKLYRLTFRDFFRRRLNVNQPSYGTNPATGTTATSAKPTESPVAATSVVDNKPRAGRSVEVQIDEIANMAWDEQIAELLHSLDPEEEWKFETSTQPQPVDESSSVSNADEHPESN